MIVLGLAIGIAEEIVLFEILHLAMHRRAQAMCKRDAAVPVRGEKLRGGLKEDSEEYELQPVLEIEL